MPINKFKIQQNQVETEADLASAVSVAKIESAEEFEVKAYSPNSIRRPGEGSYQTVKAKFGSLAATDKERVTRDRRDARFAVSPLLRNHLSVEEEERRAIEQRVDAAVQKIASGAEAQAKKEGYQEGYELGRSEALKVFQSQAQAQLGRFELILKELNDAKNKIFATNEAILMELVFRIAKRIVLKDASTDRELVLRTAKQILEKLDLRDNVVIRMHPEDLKQMSDIDARLKVELGTMRNLSIEPSDRVSRGGVQIDTDLIRVSSDIETQLNVIRESLIGPVT